MIVEQVKFLTQKITYTNKILINSFSVKEKHKILIELIINITVNLIMKAFYNNLILKNKNDIKYNNHRL